MYDRPAAKGRILNASCAVGIERVRARRIGLKYDCGEGAGREGAQNISAAVDVDTISDQLYSRGNRQTESGRDVRADADGSSSCQVVSVKLDDASNDHCNVQRVSWNVCLDRNPSRSCRDVRVLHAGWDLRDACVVEPSHNDGASRRASGNAELVSSSN